MTIGPHRLNSVATDLLDTGQLERPGPERCVRPFVEVAHNVRFSFARRARTVMPQSLQRNERLIALAPLYGEICSDDLNIDGPHT